jgi:Site-specific recombinase XerD
VVLASLGSAIVFPMDKRSSTLIGALREELGARRASPRTVEAYEMWARRYVRFHGRRHPRAMGADEVASFLEHLADERRVAASTYNQARAALRFLYREVLEQDAAWLDEISRARQSHPLPTVLTRGSVDRVLAQRPGLSSTPGIVLELELMVCGRAASSRLPARSLEAHFRRGAGVSRRRLWSGRALD